VFGKLIAANDVDCWLVNTGWTGGAHPEGERIRIACSRALVRAATSGLLTGMPFARDPVFGIEEPLHCPGVPDELLRPGAPGATRPPTTPRPTSWPSCFTTNFAAYADQAAPEVLAAGPLM
jgi:phosphoenolpyruvate carboxykinase (ATP)